MKSKAIALALTLLNATSAHAQLNLEVSVPAKANEYAKSLKSDADRLLEVSIEKAKLYAATAYYSALLLDLQVAQATRLSPNKAVTTAFHVRQVPSV